jgi:hypothetical protein
VANPRFNYQTGDALNIPDPHAPLRSQQDALREAELEFQAAKGNTATAQAARQELLDRYRQQKLDQRQAFAMSGGTAPQSFNELDLGQNYAAHDRYGNEIDPFGHDANDAAMVRNQLGWADTKGRVVGSGTLEDREFIHNLLNQNPADQPGVVNRQPDSFEMKKVSNLLNQHLDDLTGVNGAGELLRTGDNGPLRGLPPEDKGNANWLYHKRVALDDLIRRTNRGEVPNGDQLMSAINDLNEKSANLARTKQAVQEAGDSPINVGSLMREQGQAEQALLEARKRVLQLAPNERQPGAASAPSGQTVGPDYATQTSAQGAPIQPGATYQRPYGAPGMPNLDQNGQALPEGPGSWSLSDLFNRKPQAPQPTQDLQSFIDESNAKARSSAKPVPAKADPRSANELAERTIDSYLAENPEILRMSDRPIPNLPENRAQAAPQAQAAQNSNGLGGRPSMEQNQDILDRANQSYRDALLKAQASGQPGDVRWAESAYDSLKAAQRATQPQSTGFEIRPTLSQGEDQLRQAQSAFEAAKAKRYQVKPGQQLNLQQQADLAAANLKAGVHGPEPEEGPSLQEQAKRAMTPGDQAQYPMVKTSQDYHRVALGGVYIDSDGVPAVKPLDPVEAFFDDPGLTPEQRKSGIVAFNSQNQHLTSSERIKSLMFKFGYDGNVFGGKRR